MSISWRAEVHTLTRARLYAFRLRLDIRPRFNRPPDRPLLSWLVGFYVLKMDPIILAGAVAGARNSTTAMRAISDKSKSAIPSFGYPVTYALSTVVFLVYGYLAILLT